MSFVGPDESAFLPAIQPGKKFTHSRPIGSGDALLLARFVQQQRDAGRMAAIFTAEPGDTQRLEDELKFFAPELKVAVFPDWETLPYDSFSPHQDLISERLATLWELLQSKKTKSIDVVLMPASTALARLAPPSFLAATTFNFKQKQRLDEASLRAQLTLAGYTNVSQVVQPGEYAVRGGLIDLFPMGSAVPYRVDLFGDEVDSIRTFDPDSQRSLYPVPEVRMLPGREFPMDEVARKRFREPLAREDGRRPDQGAHLQATSATASPPVASSTTCPLFFERDGKHVRLPGRAVGPGPARRGGRRPSSASGRTRASALPLPAARPRAAAAAAARAVPDDRGFLRPGQPARRAVGARQRAGIELRTARCPTSAVERGAQDPLARLEAHLKSTPHRVLLLAESEGRRESLLEQLRDHKI